MQKLVWQNGNGDVLEFTGNYAITDWEGFANAPLNIQSQQVPFQDGGVFLDALIEKRSLSVTLAMYDGGNLEERYRMQRELIHSLNPKSGEGYLIYTNNYISKRIKCVAQIPLFKTHNSNESGTPKASLSWTACEPYWEDLEETRVSLKAGVRKFVKNDGDVNIGVKVDLFMNDVTNPQIKNLSENKMIKLNGVFSNSVNINTNLGEKTINAEELNIKLSSVGTNINCITYSESKGLFIAVGSPTLIYTSTDGINWVQQSSGLSDELFYSVAYSETLDLFVIVGSGRTILTSSNGINWTRQTDIPESVLTTVQLYSVTYSESQGLFVAVGDNVASTSRETILTSSDGISWEQQIGDYSGVHTLYSVTYSERLGLFVGCGASGYVVTSSDGINWDLQNRPSGFIWELYSITYSESQGLFVAVGVYGFAVTSTDGINWTAIDRVVTETLRGIVYSNFLNMFVAVGDNGTVLFSYKGVVWNKRDINTSSNIRSVIYSTSLGEFIAMGENGVIILSYDGEGWSIINDGVSSSFLNSITYSESQGLFVLVGNRINNEAVIATSTDGINWVRRSSGVPIDLVSVTYSERLKLFVAIGGSATILTSSDGITWTRQTSVPSHSGWYESVTYSESLGLFVAVGTSKKIVTSTDGINWTLRNISFNYDFYSVTYSESLGLFVAVGTSYAITSTDGINWDLVSGLYGTFRSITYSESLGLFVVVGTGGAIIISQDGVTWSSVNSGTSEFLYGVTYSNGLGLFIAVGAEGSVLTSTDGINWTIKSSGTFLSLRSVTHSEKLAMFVIVGFYGAILISTLSTTGDSLISAITSDSDMSLGLNVGDNELLLTNHTGSLNGSIRFRQKYIGV